MHVLSQYVVKFENAKLCILKCAFKIHQKPPFNMQRVSLQDTRRYRGAGLFKIYHLRRPRQNILDVSLINKKVIYKLHLALKMDEITKERSIVAYNMLIITLILNIFTFLKIAVHFSQF
jgi:hypothetical protein